MGRSGDQPLVLGGAEPQDLIRKPEVVGSPDPPRNKVAAWVCAHAEVGGEGGRSLCSFSAH